MASIENRWLKKEHQLHAAVEELHQAEIFFNDAEAHQLDFAIAQLNAAREKVDMLCIEAKGGEF